MSDLHLASVTIEEGSCRPEMKRHDLWEKAIQLLDPDERGKIPAHHGQAVVFETVLSNAKGKQAECERKHWKYQKRDGTEVELRQIFSRVVHRLGRFKAIGDSVAAIDPAHLAIPWAAISLALQIAVSDSQSYQTVLEGIETFSGLVPRYALFEQLYLRPTFPLQESLEQALVKLYAAGLRYLIKANDYYATKTLKRVAKGLVQSYGVFEEWMDEIREQQRVADELARLIDAQASRLSDEKLDSITKEQDTLLKGLEEFQAPIQTIQDGLADLVNSWSQHEKEAQKTRILAWLSPISSAVLHRQRLDARLPGSGQWVFKEEDYVKWRVSSGSSVLWLHGLPGTGKSTLVSTIVDNLQADHAHAPGTLLAYAFCSRNRSDTRWQDPATLVRSWISQLARLPSGALRGEVIRAYEDLVQKEGDTAAAQGAGLSWTDASQLLLQLLDQGTTTLCIDALDECAEESRASFLALIDHLVTRTDGGRVKILISSRPSLHIAKRFPSWPCYSVNAAQNNADIEAYARVQAAKCLEEMRHRVDSVSATLAEDLTKHLVSGAQGMFLWVELRAKMLLRQSSRAIFEGDLLNPSADLAQPLAGLFEDIYERILSSGSRSCQIALTVFRWLLCAQTTIPADDLVQAISTYLQGASIVPEQARAELNVAMVLDICQDLLLVDAETKSIRLVHTAVRDFLESKDGLQPAEQHAVVAELCLATVKNLAWAHQGETPRARSPFQHYVVLYWASHVAQAGLKHRTENIHEALQDLRDERPWFRSWLPEIQPASSLVLRWDDPHKDKIMQALSSPATSYFTACAFGFVEVVRHCIRSQPNVIHKTNTMGATGLHLAAEYGHQDIAEMLCQHGASVHSFDEDGETPLTRAAAEGHKDLVLFLLQTGASQRTQGRRYGSALYGAALNGRLQVIKVLLSHGADLTVDYGQLGTPLHAACLRGHVHVVKYLLDSGADVNAPGAVDGTAQGATAALNALSAIEQALEQKDVGVSSERYASAEARQEQRLQCLLDENIHMNVLPGGFGPPLHLAARAGQEVVVSTLLNHPQVDVNLKGGQYGSALQAAAMAGRTSVVQRLLDAGADVNMQAGQFGTALTGACRQANTGLVDALLRAGAAVNLLGGAYGNALQAACRSGSHTLVQRLLDAGADVNLTGGNYCTALQAAARDGYEQTVRVLLQHGADVHIEGGVFGSALQAAAAGGHQNLVELLVAAKAGVQGGLQMACLGGHQRLVQYFLDEGGCSVNDRSDKSGTAIQAAMAGQHDSLSDWLLARGSSISDSSGRLGTVLQLAAWAGKTDLVGRCLQHGADPWEVNHLLNMDALRQLGRTPPPSISVRDAFPIVLAAAEGHSEVVRLLLEASWTKPDRSRQHPGQVEISSTNSKSGMDKALRVALKKNQDAIVTLLLRHDFSVDLATIECACHTSNSDLVLSLLERCRPRDRYNKTVKALSAAASNGRTSLVEALLPRVLNSNEFASADLAAALREAVSTGHPETVDRLLQSGAPPTFQHPHSVDFDTGKPLMETVLPTAVACGQKEIVRALLSHETPVNIADHTHGTALQTAAYSGAEDIVADLLEHGADPNVEGGTYGTAVQAAAAAGHENIVQRLIEAGANLHTQGGQPGGWHGPYIQFLWGVSHRRGAAKQYKRLTQEFERAAQAQPARHQSGFYGTAIQAAAITGNVKIVAMLFEAGADLNDRDQFGQTPLHRAAFHGHYELVRFLVNSGAQLEAIDCHCRTPMLLSVIGGDRATFLYLFNLAPKSGSPPRASKQHTALYLAAEHGRIEIIEHLITAGSDLEVPNADGETALLIAARYGWRSAVRLLLNNGADIHRRNKDHETALHRAAGFGHDDVVRLLLASGAPILVLTSDGRSALHEAIERDHYPVAYFLLEHSVALLDLRDSRGMTPLHQAALSGHSAMVALLLEKGADVHAKNSNGHTPLDICDQQEPPDQGIRKLLVQHGAGSGQVVQAPVTNSDVDSDSDLLDEAARADYHITYYQAPYSDPKPNIQPQYSSSGSDPVAGKSTARDFEGGFPYERPHFEERPGTYSSDEEDYDAEYFHVRPDTRRFAAEHSERDYSRQRVYDESGDSHGAVRDDDRPDSDRGVRGDTKRNDPSDHLDEKDKIHLLFKCTLLIMIAIMTVVLLAVLVTLAMTLMMLVMMFFMMMWNMKSLMLARSGMVI